MKKYQRVIVALDNTSFDEKLLKYFDQFSDLSTPAKVHFTHVDKDLAIPAHLAITYRDEVGKEIPKDELLRKIFEQKIRDGFGERHGATSMIDILEGAPLKELLHWEKVKEADLLVMGNKKFSNGSGIVARKIARDTEASVLFVPETRKTSIKKILVPVDFSDHSKTAMEGAIEIAAELGDATITGFNVFDVPLTGYPTINANFDTFLKNMCVFKEEAFANYVGQFDAKEVKISTDYTHNEYGDVARNILEYAMKHEFDLIVMSSKGHTALERLFMGSVTEKLLSLDKDIPVLVLRS